MPGRIVFYLLFILLSGSCSTGSRHNKSGEPADTKPGNKAASGFSITDFGTYRRLTVIDPWQKSTHNRFDYYLLDQGAPLPDSCKDQPVFRTPVQRAVCLSTTHIGFLDALKQTHTIVGLSGSAYLSNPELKQGIAAQRVHEVGYEQGLNYELMLQLKPDVVFAYGVGSEINVQLNKLRDLGIPVVLIGEYLEQSPLAKAEWIKFFAPFFNKQAEAGKLFDSIQSNYESIRHLAAAQMEKPSVLTGLPFKDTWWMAGGQSNLAMLIRDAGGNFLWHDNPSKEAFPVSLEEVFLRASKADFWINCGTVGSMTELMAFDKRFSDLPAVKQKQVYNNNLRSTDGGGNDYWESGVMHPDQILQDLVNILHPGIKAQKTFFYFKKIE